MVVKEVMVLEASAQLYGGETRARRAMICRKEGSEQDERGT
jgi:hypothetical protein